MLYWRYFKDMQTYFGYFGHVCMHTPKMISTCTILWCLSVYKKTNFIIHFFLEISHFKESCNLIGWQQWELEFYQIWDWWWNISNISFHFRLFPRKTMTKFLEKSKQKLFWGYFGPFLPKIWQKWIFLEKRVLSVFRYSNYLSLCQKLEKLLSNFWGKHQTDGQTNRQWWFYKTPCRQVFGDYLFSTYKIVQNLTSPPPLSM